MRSRRRPGSGSISLSAGTIASADGWLGRAQRLLDAATRDSVEQGYLMIPAVFRHEAAGDFEAAAALAGEAAAIAERFGDPDGLRCA